MGGKEEGYRLRARIRKVSLSLFIAPPFIIEFWGIVLIKVVIFFFFFLSFFQQSFNPVPNVVIPVVLPGKFCSIFEEWREREREILHPPNSFFFKNLKFSL